MRIVKLDRDSRQSLLGNLLKRNTTQYPEYEARVNEIVGDVKARGDEAVFSYTARFDGAVLDASTVEVSAAEIDEAYEKVDPELLRIIRRAIGNIRAFHGWPAASVPA